MASAGNKNMLGMLFDNSTIYPAEKVGLTETKFRVAMCDRVAPLNPGRFPAHTRTIVKRVSSAAHSRNAGPCWIWRVKNPN